MAVTDTKVKLAVQASMLPGITVEQVLKIAGLPPTDKDDINKLILNLPGENS